MRTTLMAVAIAIAAWTAAAQESQHALAVKHLRAGREAVQREHWADAEREFTLAIELDPMLHMAHYGLGQVYMGTKRYDEAVKAYIKTREVYHQNEVDRLAHGADAERRLNDQILAMRDEKRNLETGRFTTGNPMLTALRLDNEIAQLEEARNRHVGSPEAVPPYISMALGSAYFRTSAFADAEREWRAAVAVNPKVGEVHNNLAVVLMVTGRYDEADREVALAEKNGFKVSPVFKQDLKARMAAK